VEAGGSNRSECPASQQPIVIVYLAAPHSAATVSDSHYQSTLDAVNVDVVTWWEFPIVPSYPDCPQPVSFFPEYPVKISARFLKSWTRFLPKPFRRAISRSHSCLLSGRGGVLHHEKAQERCARRTTCLAGLVVQSPCFGVLHSGLSLTV